MSLALLALLLALATDPPQVEPDTFCTGPTLNCRGWQEQHDALAWIKVENAEAEARAAIAAGDYRLYGVYGYAVVVPGTDHGGALPNGCGLKTIQGTSDGMVDVEAQFRARDYAKAYNAAILAATHCLGQKISRLGMGWHAYVDDDQQNLIYGVPASDYDLAFWYCEKGRINLTLTRLAKDWVQPRLSIRSGGVSLTTNASLRSLDRRVFGPGYVVVRASFSSAEPVFDAFGQGGDLALNRESFDAQSDDERAAVRRFVGDCRTRGR